MVLQMSKLAAYYFHFDFKVEEYFAEEYKNNVTEIVRVISSEIYNQNVKVEINIENGSTKKWIAIAGALYLAIGNYGSFRSGIDQIIDDSKVIQKVIESKFLKSGLKKDQIIEEKRIISTPDRLRKLYLRLDRFEKNYNTLTIEEKEKDLSSIKELISRLVYDIDSEEDLELLKKDIKAKNIEIYWDYYHTRNYVVYKREDKKNIFLSINKKI